MLRILPLAGFIIIAALCAATLFMGKDPAVQPSALIGRAAPVPAPRTGTALVNFFASWCLSCVAEQDVLTAIARDTGVPIYGVNYKDTRTAAEAWLTKHGNPYRTVMPDPLGTAAIDWGVTGVPETFVVADGVVTYRVAGPVTEEIYKNEIAPLLKGVQK